MVKYKGIKEIKGGKGAKGVKETKGVKGIKGFKGTKGTKEMEEVEEFIKLSKGMKRRERMKIKFQRRIVGRTKGKTKEFCRIIQRKIKENIQKILREFFKGIIGIQKGLFLVGKMDFLVSIVKSLVFKRMIMIFLNHLSNTVRMGKM